MKKYLVNYRVAVKSTPTIPYLEYTTTYRTQDMMTHEDVEAFEKAKTKEHGSKASMISFCELKYSTPTLEDYIVALPYFTFENDIIQNIQSKAVSFVLFNAIRDCYTFITPKKRTCGWTVKNLADYPIKNFLIIGNLFDRKENEI